jgi:outer membrane protein assembly factor BamB
MKPYYLGKLSVQFILSALCFLFCFDYAAAAPAWTTKLDGDVKFYQQTELGVLLAGTEKSLYALDSATGEIVWRRKNVRLDETDVAPVPGTDLVLLSLEKGDKSRIEALDLLTGDRLWQSDKVKGSICQLAVDTNTRLIAITTIRDAKGKADDGLKRKPIVYGLDLNSGDQRWKYEIDTEVELQPLRWDDKETEFTLDNYRAPLFLDQNLYLFYEGVTVLDADSGKRQERDKFKVNEEHLALTESDPIADERYLYTSGRGKIRAIERRTGKEKWEAKDLGLTPEILLNRDALYVRTGGQFTDLRNGETVAKGDYGVSALSPDTGKTLWRYKGADKGITNIVLADENTILAADRDDLMVIDTRTGKRTRKISHQIKDAAFVILNESGQAVVGGTETIAAFDWHTGRELWRVKHSPPGRGILKVVTAIAARAASLYFRYGGVASFALRGLQVASTSNGFRWSGLAARGSFSNLTGLASSAAERRLAQRPIWFGAASRLRSGASIGRPGVSRPGIDIEDRLIDRIDPSHQLDRLSAFLLRRQQMAAMQGQWMYFYTDLPNLRQNGLAGVNINNGRTDRYIPLGDADDRFIADETTSLLYYAKDARTIAAPLNENEP